MKSADSWIIFFPTSLGWMALRTGKSAVRQLSFGNPSASAAAVAIGDTAGQGAEPESRWQCELVANLQRFAEGDFVDFSRVPIEFPEMTDFRRRVLNACRKIPYGETRTYGELAAQVGAPGAARAVGTCMARNLVPLIIPCHRVTRAGGVVGPYSAAEGTKTKRHLLDREAAHALLLQSRRQGILPEVLDKTPPVGLDY